MRETRDDLFEQPQLFPAQLRDIKKHSRHIAAWARATLETSLRNRIALQIQRNDRNVGPGVRGRGNPLWIWRQNDVHIEPNKIGRSFTCQLRLKVSKAVFDREVFALDLTRFG